MRRRRRKRDADAPEEFESQERAEDRAGREAEDALEETVDAPDERGQWPDWAYERPPRGRRSRRRRRRKRRRDRGDEPNFNAADAPFFDQAVEETEPGVWVTKETPIDGGGALEVADEEDWPDQDDVPFDEVEGAPGVVVEEGVQVGAPGAADRGADGEEEAPEIDAAPRYGSGDEEEDLDEANLGEGSEDRHWDDADQGYEPSHYQPVIGDVMPGGVGPRRAALYERKRKQRRVAGAGVVAVIVLVGIALFTLGGDGERDDDPDDRSVVTTGRDDSVESMLVYGTREADPARGATWLALLSIDRSSNRGSMVYIPAHTAVEVPGRGVLPIGQALVGDDVPLLLVSAESLLGIQIDHYLELSDRDSRVLFEALEALEVEVPAEVSVRAGPGQTRLLFPEGAQMLSGNQLAELLFTIGVEGTDVDLGSRHLAFWDAFFETYADRSDELETAMTSAGSILAESDAPAEETAGFLGDLVALPQDSLVLSMLPVTQSGVGEGELYHPDEAELRSFIQETTGARSSLGDEIRVQILNGNGVPGIGDDVAKLLVGEGFRVIISGNAQRLNYDRTLIVAYDRAKTDLAERAQELLGVGEVQISAQEQGIVDLTIVVGRDFLERT